MGGWLMLYIVVQILRKLKMIEESRLPKQAVKQVQPRQANNSTGCQNETQREWWEQFGDCYDYWPSLAEGEIDYLQECDEKRSYGIE